LFIQRRKRCTHDCSTPSAGGLCAGRSACYGPRHSPPRQRDRGKTYQTEAQVFPALASALGVETIESVLHYPVVPGAAVTYRQALKSNGAVLSTALAGSTIKVKVVWPFFVS